MKWAAVRKRLWRGLVAVLLLLILLVGIGMVYQSTASAHDRKTYDSPDYGRLQTSAVMHRHGTLLNAA
jgi:hypothetical protein